MAKGYSFDSWWEYTALSDWTMSIRGRPVVSMSEATIASRLGTM